LFELRTGEYEIRIKVSAAKRYIAGHDNHVRLRYAERLERNVPIVVKQSTARAEVKIGNVNEFQSSLRGNDHECQQRWLVLPLARKKLTCLPVFQQQSPHNPSSTAIRLAPARQVIKVGTSSPH
jgi:hypothetical protein